VKRVNERALYLVRQYCTTSSRTVRTSSVCSTCTMYHATISASEKFFERLNELMLHGTSTHCILQNPFTHLVRQASIYCMGVHKLFRRSHGSLQLTILYWAYKNASPTPTNRCAADKGSTAHIINCRGC
jgi:hypothetical protein